MIRKTVVLPPINSPTDGKEIGFVFRSTQFYNLINNLKPEENAIKGSEALRSLNFALNPKLMNRQKTRARNNIQLVEQLKSNATAITLASKNIMLLRKNRSKNQMLKQNNPSLVVKPKLKQSKSIIKGTMSMLMNNEDSRAALRDGGKGGEFVQAQKMDVSERARDKIRVQMVSWLLENRKDAVNKLTENQQIIIAWIDYVGYIDKNEFEDLLEACGIRYDQSLHERLFWLFDLNGNGVIEQKEILLALELFKEHSLDEKVKMFFDLCDDDDAGYIEEEKLIRFFKRNLRTEAERRKVRKQVVREFIDEINPQSHFAITKEELAKACETNENIKVIVEKNVKFLKTTNKQPAKFSHTNILSSQMAVNQGGVFYPYLRKIVDAISEKEAILEKHLTMKNNLMKSLKFLKESTGNDEDDDEEIVE